METEGMQQVIFRQVPGVPVNLTVIGSNRADSFIAATTTPPKIPKVNIWRLSEFSIRILEILRDCKGVTNREFCNLLGKSNNYVKQYLYRLRNKGLISRNNGNWKWYLHDLDSDFFTDLDKILNIIYNGNTKVTEKEHNGNSVDVLPQVLPINKTPEIDKKQERKPQKYKQVNLVEIFKKVTQERTDRGVEDVIVSEIENEIVLTLANWYDQTQNNATGRAYKHFEGAEEFADKLGYSMADIRHALCNLDDRGEVYTVDPGRDKYGRWKIGFTEEFLEKVKQR